MNPLRRTVPAPPVRLAHLGLGSFFRAHQAAYTDASDGAGAGSDDGWGIAAFSHERRELADALTAQGGAYTLVERRPAGDDMRVVNAVVEARPGTDHEAWLATLASPQVRVVTLTITEAGYLRSPEGGLDAARPAVVPDVEALRRDRRAPVRSAPARLLAGLLARRSADAGPVTLVPCDNLPANGEVLARVLRDLAELVDGSLLDYLEASVSVASTVVDRITPAPTSADRETVRRATGRDDRAPVITEPFREWVLAGSFPGGRPSWEAAGAVFTDDVEPFEQRKLWLLNGGHSLLAYVGLARGWHTVSEAVADEVCRDALRAWWALCGPHLLTDPEAAHRYCEALLERFANPRIAHALAQIATDGTQKLPVRILPVLRLERSAGRLPDAVVLVLAAWVDHVRVDGGRVDGVPVDGVRADAATGSHGRPRDVRAGEFGAVPAGGGADTVRAALSLLDPDLAADDVLVAAVGDVMSRA